ncbi:MAG: hypothetical protein N4J56_006640 [Chroococcidiopsis sp. SAG 2025]|uniref:ester cyclase n=1 Tax=Chroococcidiopsis sp. SAG 2025 TaxID=171389 RepID=UPI0029370BA1|nr:ester cyclase [Chroococcidiopsis sp. SAG 2025]MDV2996935.1 hypothetical protein [Chroococcidiopsis sp. SAG 2025]
MNRESKQYRNQLQLNRVFRQFLPTLLLLVVSLLTFSSIVTIQGQPVRSASTSSMLEQNKAVIRRYYDELINQGNFDVADELIATDLVQHSKGTAQGREGIVQEMQNSHNVFSNFNIKIDDLIAENDKVVVRATVSGVHAGTWMNITATRKPVQFPSIDIFRVVDGKLQEHWDVTDRFGLMQQLEAASAPS